MLVDKALPPLEAAYQLKVPVNEDDAPITTIPVPHRLAFKAVTAVETTAAVTATRVLVHVAFAYST